MGSAAGTISRAVAGGEDGGGIESEFGAESDGEEGIGTSFVSVLEDGGEEGNEEPPEYDVSLSNGEGVSRTMSWDRKKVKAVFGKVCAMCLVRKGLRKETNREEDGNGLGLGSGLCGLGSM